MRRRIQALRRRLKQQNLSAAYLTSDISRRYFTGFAGTAGSVLVTPSSAILFTDFRYTERASEEVSEGVSVIEGKKGLLTSFLKAEKISRLGIEDHNLTMVMHEGLSKALKGIKLVGIGNAAESVRAVKDEQELAILRQAISATDDVFAEAVRWLKQQKRAKRLPTEAAMAWKIRDIIHTKKLGELSFDTIIAAGPNSARPHHEPTSRKLKLGDPVVIDMGVAVQGYHADMTRTVFLGKPTTKLEAMYRTTLRAQQAAIAYLRKGGRSAHGADAAARQIIDTKFPGSFGHALGHGVGLEVHEHPTLSPNSPHKLTPSMVFSVEPGIYIPGEGGIRIEDLVLLKKDGIEVLSKSPRKLAIV